MATIIQRRDKTGKNHFTVQIRLKGHPLQCATFDRKTDAKEWAQTTEADIKAGRHFKDAEAKRHTMGEMIDRYIAQVLPHKSKNTIEGQTGQLNWWKAQLGHLTLADVTPSIIVEARDSLAMVINPRTKAPLSNASVGLYMAALSHAFTIAIKEWQWCTENPFRQVSKPPKPRGRVRFLTDDERIRLLEECRNSGGPDLHPIVVLALSTGMRKNEILSLTWENADLARRMITLHDTKNKERRAVAIAGYALDLLTERAKVRRLDTSLVFPAPFRHGQKPKPIDIRSAWEWAVKRAGIADFRFHDLRHSAASYLLMSGASLGELAEILGHKTLQMVRRYSHISQPHAARIVERMNNVIFSDTETATGKTAQ